MDKEAQIATFLNDYFRGITDQYVSLFFKPQKGARGDEKTTSSHFPVSLIDKAATFALERAKTEHVYFGMTPRKRDLGAHHKGGEEDIGAVVSFWADIDVYAPGAHAKQDLPTRSEAGAILGGVHMKPTYLIDSGYGLHAHWLLDEPFFIKNEGDRSRVKSWMAAWQRFLITHARNLGFHMDNLSPLSSVLRVPFTVNYKIKDEPKDVVIDASENRHYPFEYFMGYINADLGAPRSEPGKSNKKPPAETNKQSVAVDAQLDGILDGCSFMAHCRDDAADISEWEWFLMMTIVAHCENGNDLAHQLSEPYPNYSDAETTMKFRRAQAGKPATCEKIAATSGGAYCQGCPNNGKVKTPLSLGRREQREADLFTFEENVESLFFETPLKARSFGEFITLGVPQSRNIVEPWLPSPGLAMVYGPAGVGKTYFSVGLAGAISTGVPFLKWTVPTARHVLYLDGEMALGQMQDRFMSFLREDPGSRLQIFSPQDQAGPLPDLSSPEGQSLVNGLIAEETDVIIVDNISAWVRNGDENTDEHWQPMLGWLGEKKREGRTVILVHHAGKPVATRGGMKSVTQRGTSKRVDNLDTVIQLIEAPRSPDWAQGASVKLTFEKARSFFGADREPILAALREDAGFLTWEQFEMPGRRTTRAKQVDVQSVIELKTKGMLQQDIAKELGVSPSTICRIWRSHTLGRGGS